MMKMDLRRWGLALLIPLAGCAEHNTRAYYALKDRPPDGEYVAKVSYHALVDCLQEHILTQYEMSRLNAGDATEFGYNFGISWGGEAMLIVDVYDRDPPIADVYISGGPWFGWDTSLKSAVARCAAGGT